jgi:hypothetical protein
VTRPRAPRQVGAHKTAANPNAYPTAGVAIVFHRRARFYLWKVLVPLYLVTFMSFAVFFFDVRPPVGSASQRSSRLHLCTQQPASNSQHPVCISPTRLTTNRNDMRDRGDD